MTLFDAAHDAFAVDASISMPASMDSWDELIGFTEVETDRSSLSPSKKYGMKLAIEELLSNIIRSNSSASSAASNSWVEVSRLAVSNEPDSLFLEIKDNGLPFNPHFENLDETITETPLLERPIGGLGLLLVKKSVDEVGYLYRGSCNTYRLFSSDRSPDSL